MKVFDVTDGDLTYKFLCKPFDKSPVPSSSQNPPTTTTTAAAAAATTTTTLVTTPGVASFKGSISDDGDQDKQSDTSAVSDHNISIVINTTAVDSITAPNDRSTGMPQANANASFKDSISGDGDHDKQSETSAVSEQMTTAIDMPAERSTSMFSLLRNLSLGERQSSKGETGRVTSGQDSQLVVKRNSNGSNASSGDEDQYIQLDVLSRSNIRNASSGDDDQDIQSETSSASDHNTSNAINATVIDSATAPNDLSTGFVSWMDIINFLTPLSTLEGSECASSDQDS